MKFVFIDTNGWVALRYCDDGLHERAKQKNKELQTGRYTYITTNFALDETYTFLSCKNKRQSAKDLGNYIRKGCEYISSCGQKTCRFDFKRCKLKVIDITKEIEEEAWDLFNSRDQNYSFTDCTSFVVMKKEKINEVFTEDEHFSHHGFYPLLRET
jgi:predicted nucleic acid-binding protein